MPLGPRAEIPVEEAVRLSNRDVVDARLAALRQAVLVELPLLVAMGAKPACRRIARLVDEADGDAVCGEGPDLLDEAVLELALPLAGEKGLDCRPPFEELRTISPPAVFRVCERDACGVAAVPCILGEPGLLRGGFGVERRQGRAVHGFSFADA